MISPKACQNIGEMLCDAAFTIFADCEAESDFCVQHVAPDSVVFGGTNRVLFHPERGFHPDPSYCTRRFLKKWEEVKGPWTG